MPQYLFTNGKDTKEIFFHMNDEKRYFEDGLEWDRVYTIPTSSIDSHIDPFNSQDFTEKTGKKKGSLGNLFDQSRELSEKRAQKVGIDPLKQAYYDRYKKIRNRDHGDIVVKKAKEKLDKLGVVYE